MPLEKTRRVSARDPCSICGRRDWCLVASDGRYAICMRTQSEHPARSGEGYIHRLDGRTPYRPAPHPSHDRAAANGADGTVAPLEQRDRVYRRLLAACRLGGRHTLELQARGYSCEEMAARGYRSLHLQGRKHLAECSQNGSANSLAGVPGYYTKTGQDDVTFWTLGGSPGLLVPCRSPEGRIRGLRIRRDDAGDANKYHWLSSKGKPGGAGSGLHCHVARPLSGQLRDEATWITEGEIKADLAAERLGAIVVSIPGVASWSQALPDLAELLPAGGRVVIGLDADWRTNPAVHGALWSLALACLTLGYNTEVAIWEAGPKGLDDLLTAGLSPQRTAPGNIPPPEWRPRLSSRKLAELPAQARRETVTLADVRAKLPEVFASLCPCG